MKKNECVAVVGLGYVGLPLVVEFGKFTKTIGFDISLDKVLCCRNGTDPSREISDADMAKASMAEYTNDAIRLPQSGKTQTAEVRVRAQ